MYVSVDGYCDWSYKATCQLTTAQVEAIRLPEPRYMYLTIDDTPSDGLDITLDAMLVFLFSFHKCFIFIHFLNV